MSLSGCRPAVTLSRSSRKREPAFGPRLTTSSAAPADNPSTPPMTSSAESAPAVPNRPPAKIDVESEAPDDAADAADAGKDPDPRSLSVTRHSFVSPWLVGTINDVSRSDDRTVPVRPVAARAPVRRAKPVRGPVRQRPGSAADVGPQPSPMSSAYPLASTNSSTWAGSD